ncbi:Plant tudor-like RNA-binding protein [Quillaja saponaria]|uniref:Plant tudor-like RNA-binding protein n=1 Tax=Quillaja saponaria TaxID=32244 RepID=A0AAD7PIY1_QUISA|nr:Plant tudor-like RNA-binding protein [Quillaja saponaria]
MRFKKGSKVEVLIRKEVPPGSWRCAKIIWANGNNYTVRYDVYRGATDKDVIETVSRKDIRPCPPSVEVAENWMPGDVVEVFENVSWKMATILRVLDEKYILVRLLGSSMEFIVSRFDIRLRQSWQDDKWIVIGKGSGNCENGKNGNRFTLGYNLNSSPENQKRSARETLPVQNDCCPEKKEENFLESYLVSSRTLKRGSPYCQSQVEAYAEGSQKFRAIEKEGRCHRAVAANQYTFLEQVDAVVLPRDTLGKKCMHASINNRTTGISEVDIERRKPTGAVGCSFAINLESNDADSVTCSVGSCSITSNNSYKLHHHVCAYPIEDLDGQNSDAESVCQSAYEEEYCPLPTREELAEEIHRLELHAYRCTMEALHASGPLSWEKEALVTNLRLSLHISNDEHLMEIRNLISSENSIAIR